MRNFTKGSARAGLGPRGGRVLLREEVEEPLAKERGVDADAARAILEGLKSEGRYLREIWS